MTDETFPKYRTNNGQIFKLLSQKKVISIRVDQWVKGIGIYDNLTWKNFVSILTYPECSEREYYDLFNEIISLIRTAE